MTAGAYATYLGTYAQSIAAPILSEVNVTDVTHDGVEFRVSTSVGEWRSGGVVVATGACETPYRPSMAGNLASCIHQINPSDYREPTQLPTGGVLVVGASATGAQLAEEIHASGRPVTLSVGEHTRVPRRYRGRDTYAWMETTGILDDPALESGNLDAARRQPSLQLVGRPDNRDLDLGILQAQGIRLVGRLAAVEGTSAKFNDDLASTTSASHSRMLRILDRIDGAIMSRGLRAGATEPSARIPFRATGGGVTLDLKRRRHPFDRLGHRLRAPLSLAPCPCSRWPRRNYSPRRSCGGARALCSGAYFSASAQVIVHRRLRSRCR